MRLCDHQQAAYPLCCAHGAQIPCFPLRDSSGGLKLSICNRVCTAPPRVHGLLCLRHKPAGPDPTQRQRMWVWGKRGHTMTCSHPEWGHRHPRLAQRPWSPPECGHRYPLAGRHPLAGTDIPGGHRGRGLTPSAGTDTPGWHRGHGLTPSVGTDTPQRADIPWLAQTPPVGTEAMVSPPGWHRHPRRAQRPWSHPHRSCRPRRARGGRCTHTGSCPWYSCTAQTRGRGGPLHPHTH